MGLLKKVVIASTLVASVMFFNPFWIWSGTKDLLGVGVSYLTNSRACTDVQVDACFDPHSLKSAMRNVTTDYDQLASIVQEFFRQQRLPLQHALFNSSNVEDQFREFLSHKASRSFPALENSLDWVLTIYKIAFPFMIFMMILKLSGGSGEPGKARKAHQLDGSYASAPSSPSASSLSGHVSEFSQPASSEHMLVPAPCGRHAALHRQRY